MALQDASCKLCDIDNGEFVLSRRTMGILGSGRIQTNSLEGNTLAARLTAIIISTPPVVGSTC